MLPAGSIQGLPSIAIIVVDGWARSERDVVSVRAIEWKSWSGDDED